MTTKTKKKKPSRTNKPAIALHRHVSVSADFMEAIPHFVNYEPVKVAREMKEDFFKALSNHFMENGMETWKATLTPFKEYWRFKRN